MSSFLLAEVLKLCDSLSPLPCIEREQPSSIFIFHRKENEGDTSTSWGIHSMQKAYPAHFKSLSYMNREGWRQVGRAYLWWRHFLAIPAGKWLAQELIGSLNLDCEVGKGFYSELWVVSSQVLKNRDAPTWHLIISTS